MTAATACGAVSTEETTSTSFIAGRRVEEVQAQHALGAGRVGGEAGHGQGVGAGREDRLGAHDAVERAEDLLLDLVRLRRHLDDEVGVGRGPQVGEGAEAGEGVRALLLGEPAALHGAGGGGLQGGDPHPS